MENDDLLDLNESDFDAEEVKKQQDRAKVRNKDLSDKLKAEAEAREKAETERAQALKESEFYKSLNTLTSKYPGSIEFQDKIKEKFMAGYTAEDATVSVLNAEGKFSPTAPEPEIESPTGGSAVNRISDKGEKKPSEMSRDELRDKLVEREAELRDLISPKFRA